MIELTEWLISIALALPISIISVLLVNSFLDKKNKQTSDKQ